MSPSARGILLATLTGICWAVLAIVLKFASGFMSSGSIAWARMSVASGILAGYFAFKSPQTYRKVFTTTPLLCVLGALLLAFNYFGFMKGVELTTASNAQIMIQSGPVLLLLAGVFYFSESLKPLQWMGVIGAVVGFTLFYFDQSKLNLSGAEMYSIGNIWILTGASAWALFAIFQKVLLKRNWKPAELNLITYFICALALTGPVHFSEFSNLSWSQIAVLAFLGINTVVAYGSFAEAMSLLPASQVSLIITCNPLLTIILIHLMHAIGFDVIPPEPMGWRGVIGALLVVTGVAVAVGAPLFLQHRKNKKSLAKSLRT